jgi:hypothetical protein
MKLVWMNNLKSLEAEIKKYKLIQNLMQKELVNELSSYFSRKYFNNIIDFNFSTKDRCVIGGKKKLNFNKENLRIDFGIVESYNKIQTYFYVQFIDKYDNCAEFDNGYWEDGYLDNLYTSDEFQNLAPIINKFTSNNHYMKIGDDIYQYYRKLYDTDFLYCLPKAITFYLCNNVTKIFPRDIAKIIYKTILFFTIKNLLYYCFVDYFCYVAGECFCDVIA